MGELRFHGLSDPRQLPAHLIHGRRAQGFSLIDALVQGFGDAQNLTAHLFNGLCGMLLHLTHLHRHLGEPLRHAADTAGGNRLQALGQFLAGGLQLLRKVGRDLV